MERHGIIRDISERKQNELQIKWGIDILKTSLNETITAFALIVEQRDPYTVGHQQRVSQLAFAIAEEMGLLENQVEGINIAGIVHDVGKIQIPS